MLTELQDPKLRGLVCDLRSAGASDRSIAAALNAAGSVSPDGKRWHPRQVAMVCTAPAGNGASCDCRYHRRLEVLRAIRGWQPFDAEVDSVIRSLTRVGESAATIAGVLNRADLPAPSGRRWTPRLVTALVRLTVPAEAPTAA